MCFPVDSWEVSGLAVTSMIIKKSANLCVPRELTINAGGAQRFAKFTVLRVTFTAEDIAGPHTTESKSLAPSWACSSAFVPSSLVMMMLVWGSRLENGW